jgi:hypothetical protein
MFDVICFKVLNTEYSMKNFALCFVHWMLAIGSSVICLLSSDF